MYATLTRKRDRKWSWRVQTEVKPLSRPKRKTLGRPKRKMEWNGPLGTSIIPWLTHSGVFPLSIFAGPSRSSLACKSNSIHKTRKVINSCDSPSPRFIKHINAVRREGVGWPDPNEQIGVGWKVYLPLILPLASEVGFCLSRYCRSSRFTHIVWVVRTLRFTCCCQELKNTHARTQACTHTPRLLMCKSPNAIEEAIKGLKHRVLTSFERLSVLKVVHRQLIYTVGLTLPVQAYSPPNLGLGLRARFQVDEKNKGVHNMNPRGLRLRPLPRDTL
jgi:hypothetical protein